MKSFVLLAAVVLSSGCTRVYDRKEWREYFDLQKGSYLRAVQCLQEKPSQLSVDPKVRETPTNRQNVRGQSRNRQDEQAQSGSRHDDFVQVHLKAFKFVHNTPQFLPWYRVFVAAYDRELRETCNYLGPMPYWDWSIDSQAPETSAIWEYFGPDHCNKAPRFGKFTSLRKVDCVPPNLLPGSLYSQEQLAVILASNSYDSFRVALERNPHNLLLAYIGGTIANPETAPHHPLFFLHLRNLDRLWSRWQEKNPSLALTYNGARVTLQDEMNFFGLFKNNVKVKDALDSKSGAVGGLMCYSYHFSRSVTTLIAPRLQNTPGTTPETTDRQNKDKMRPPQEIPEEYLRQRGYSREVKRDIRNREAQIAAFTDIINQTPLKILTLGLYENANKDNRWKSKSKMQQDYEDKALDPLVKDFLRTRQ